MYSEPLPGVAGCGEAVPGRGAVHRGRDQPPGPLCGQVSGSMRTVSNVWLCSAVDLHLQLIC